MSQVGALSPINRSFNFQNYTVVLKSRITEDDSSQPNARTLDLNNVLSKCCRKATMIREAVTK